LVGLQKAEHAGDVVVEAIQRAERFLNVAAVDQILRSQQMDVDRDRVGHPVREASEASDR
jgi:hypothetical protein